MKGWCVLCPQGGGALLSVFVLLQSLISPDRESMKNYFILFSEHYIYYHVMYLNNNCAWYLCGFSHRRVIGHYQCISSTVQVLLQGQHGILAFTAQPEIIPFSVRGQQVKESPGWCVCLWLFQHAFLYSSWPTVVSMAVLSEAQSCGVGSETRLRLMLFQNCLSLEICPHRDTWERWGGHTAGSGVKEVEGSASKAG